MNKLAWFFEELLDLEYEYENRIGRAMTESETLALFTNFLRVKMGLDPITNTITKGKGAGK